MQHWACSSFPLTFFWSSSLQKPPSFISATQEYMQYFFTALFIKRLSSRGSWVSQIFWWCKWGSSLTSWRLWQFRPVESDFSGVSRLWRSTKHALNISGEYELWYCQHEKSALYIHKKKKQLCFFSWHFHTIASIQHSDRYTWFLWLCLASTLESPMEEKSTKGC